MPPKSPDAGKTPSTLNDPTSEANRGGADAVNDTPGLAAPGTAPGYQFDVVRSQEEVRGGRRIVWLAVAVAILVIVVYAARMFR